MSLSTLLLLPPFSPTSKQSTPKISPSPLNLKAVVSQNPNTKPVLLSNLLSLAVAVTLTSPFPSLAIPFLNSSQSQSSTPSPTTPFSQSKNLATGLENGYFTNLIFLFCGFTFFLLIKVPKWFFIFYFLNYCRKIRPCPSINPGCVSTNPKSSSFSFPWSIPENSSKNAIQVMEIYMYSHFNFEINFSLWNSNYTPIISFYTHIMHRITCTNSYNDSTYGLMWVLKDMFLVNLESPLQFPSVREWLGCILLLFLCCRNWKRQFWVHRRMQRFRLWKIPQMVNDTAINPKYTLIDVFLLLVSSVFSFLHCVSTQLINEIYLL